ncbi:membrane metalloprotease [Allomuricauda sp. ARW1Y1]|uniref:membrane metalloprotease n=1 Tax=Allomuricauda sp. ARW1Y1 TaxID=2663843 RepID=UPI0017D34283|nr:membrane metalloprotease [Muricauda sp. ARW1Y1]NYJ28682.1 hypothetical protein [Muricauda sp. ARW1Y1]
MSRKYFIWVFFVFSLSCSSDGDSGGDNQPIGETVDKTPNQQAVGDTAQDLLVDETFTSLYLELYYVEGLRPSSETIDHFTDFLERRLNKPQGIRIELFEMTSPGQESYSVADIRTIEDDIRTAYNDGSALKAFGLFLDGAYAENTENGSVLGIAYRNTSFVLFSETIREFSGQPLAPSTTVLESTVLDHEFGHLLGLVNAGTPLQSQHQDVEYGRHCTAEDCLMYWTAETGEGLVNMISGGAVPPLDQACLDDLRAFGGK